MAKLEILEKLEQKLDKIGGALTGGLSIKGVLNILDNNDDHSIISHNEGELELKGSYITRIGTRNANGQVVFVNDTDFWCSQTGFNCNVNVDGELVVKNFNIKEGIDKIKSTLNRDARGEGNKTPQWYIDNGYNGLCVELNQGIDNGMPSGGLHHVTTTCPWRDITGGVIQKATNADTQIEYIRRSVGGTSWTEWKIQGSVRVDYLKAAKLVSKGGRPANNDVLDDTQEDYQKTFFPTDFPYIYFPYPEGRFQVSGDYKRIDSWYDDNQGDLTLAWELYEAGANGMTVTHMGSGSYGFAKLDYITLENEVGIIR